MTDMAVDSEQKGENDQYFQNSPSLNELNTRVDSIEFKHPDTIWENNTSEEAKESEETAKLNIAVHWIAKRLLDNKGLEILQFQLGMLGRDLKHLNSVWDGTNPLLTRAAMVYLVISFILHFIINPRLLWLMGTFSFYFARSPMSILCARMFFGFWRGVA